MGFGISIRGIRPDGEGFSPPLKSQRLTAHATRTQRDRNTFTGLITPTGHRQMPRSDQLLMIGGPKCRRRPAMRRTMNARSRGPRIATSTRRCPGGRQRTGSGSPVRLPGEIFGRRPQDVAFGVQLHRFGFKFADPRPQPAGLLLRGSDWTGRRRRVAALADRDASGFEPGRQGAVRDSRDQQRSGQPLHPQLRDTAQLHPCGSLRSNTFLPSGWIISLPPAEIRDPACPTRGVKARHESPVHWGSALGDVSVPVGCREIG
jgi:hypothetical protein